MVKEQEIREEFKNTRDVVEEVLEEDKLSRNNDKWLIFKVLQKMGFNVQLENGYLKFELELCDMYKFPSFETITRVRREIQNDLGKYLPTDPMVMHQRKIKEEIIRKYYGEDWHYQEFINLKYKVK